MAWLSDPLYWPTIAMAFAAAVLAGGAVLVRRRWAGDIAAAELRKLGRLGTVMPAAVLLLAMASAAQTLLPGHPLAHRRTASAAALPGAEAAIVSVAGSAGDTDGTMAATPALLVTPAEYALATGQLELTSGPAIASGQLAAGTFVVGAQIAPFGPAVPLRLPALAPLLLLRQAALVKQQQDQAVGKALADLLATVASTSGSTTGTAADLAGGTGTGAAAGSSGSGAVTLALPGGASPPPVLLFAAAPAEAVSDVPEPASWMTMLTGFAICGAALRRARRARARDRGASV